MGDLFGRVCRVTVFRPRGTSLFDFLPNGLEIEKLRIQFKVEKTLEAKPNTCEIIITNLESGARRTVCEKPQIVRLEAGYERDTGLRHIFTGDIRHGSSKQNGTDWETTLQLGDGSRSYHSTRISRSYRAGTSVLTVIRDAATTMGLTVPRNLEVSAALTRQFATGIQLHGSAADELSRHLAPFGYTWSMQDGQMQAVKDEETRTDRAHLITSKPGSQTGLIGSPEFQTPTAADNKKGRPPTLSFRTLLYPQLTPGGKVQLDTDTIKGTFRAERVTHTGDTHGGPWFTEVEAKPV